MATEPRRAPSRHAAALSTLLRGRVTNAFLVTMGKTNKSQPKQQFDLHKTSWTREKGMTGQGPKIEDSEKEGGAELKQIPTVMRHSHSKIDGKIDAFTFRMDRMSERLLKHAEHLHLVER
ncbi:hypothetical protein NDU88_006265 [Pleurodeles waltl]|uniref:Uncharacterized protein n=1 Tax=Pleurodeles waltl TaxID=8319 RepID=A0AAV7RPD6_PLEWA|nr:hypothetical protein NDU88_006265 [Pleurodeles waltl]